MASTASRKISAASWASNADATAYTNVSTTPVDSGVYIVVSQALMAGTSLGRHGGTYLLAICA